MFRVAHLLVSGVPNLSEGANAGLGGTSCAAEVVGWARHGAGCSWLKKGDQLGTKSLAFPSETPKTLLVKSKDIAPRVVLQGDIVLSSRWVEN